MSLGVRVDKPSECPTCKKVLTGASAIDGKHMQPVEGNISICAYCTSVLVYNKDLSLTLLPQEDFNDMDVDDRDDILYVVSKLNESITYGNKDSNL